MQHPDNFPLMDRDEAAWRVVQAQRRSGKRWSDIANAVGRSTVWTTAALLGQHSLSADEAAKAGAALSLDPDVVAALQRPPFRGGTASASGPPSDPLLYRLHEILQIYGPTVKELINEEFGDGIMSAVDFNMDVKRVADPAGDRVQVTMTGKFLPYAKW